MNTLDYSTVTLQSGKLLAILKFYKSRFNSLGHLVLLLHSFLLPPPERKTNAPFARINQGYINCFASKSYLVTSLVRYDKNCSTSLHLSTELQLIVKCMKANLHKKRNRRSSKDVCNFRKSMLCAAKGRRRTEADRKIKM